MRRHHIRLAAALSALFGLIGADAARSAVFVVTSTVDAPDQNTANGTCDAIVKGQPACTLRAALMQAATNDIVELPSGTYVLDRPRDASQTDEAVGDLDVHAETVEIRGPVGGPRPIIQSGGDYDDTLFGVHSGGCPGGGGICTGHLKLYRVVLDGLDDLAGSGGAIACGAAQLTLQDVLIRDTGVQFHGGAISASGCNIQLVRAEFRNNHAGRRGGALHLTQGSPAMTADTVSFIGNRADIGGGALHHDNYAVTLHNATFAGNRAPKGAAIWTYGAQLTTVNMTLTGNAGLDGDASESAMLFQGGTFKPANSIFSENLTSIADVALIGQLQSDGYNIVGSLDYEIATAIVNLHATDLLSAPPLNLMAPQVASWSITGMQTLPPNPGSPAVNAGHPGGGGVACRPVDANGIGRFGPCDIGAAELPNQSLFDAIFADGFEL